MNPLPRATLLMLVAATTFVGAFQAPSSKPLQTIDEGLLDEIRIYHVIPASHTVAIAVRPFSATDADLTASGQMKGELPKETKDLQERGPKLLLTELVDKLKLSGAFTEVTALDAAASPPAGAFVVEGRFTLIDPGSRAKRAFVGFGSGKSGVAVAGSVKAADGTLFATFAQKRIGVMGIGGGDSTGKLVKDTTSIGEDIAGFLAAWSNGKKLK